MENDNTKRDQEALRIIAESCIERGYKQIKGAWFPNEEEFNRSKSKRPEIYGGIDFKTAPILDDGINKKG
jgi:hypothetical protein